MITIDIFSHFSYATYPYFCCETLSDSNIKELLNYSCILSCHQLDFYEDYFKRGILNETCLISQDYRSMFVQYLSMITLLCL